MLPSGKLVHTRMWWQQWAICAHKDLHVGLIFLAVATTFALGAESNRLPACLAYGTAARYIDQQPPQAAGCSELFGQSGLSGPALCQFHRVTSTAPLASSPAKNQLQACRHHIQDQTPAYLSDIIHEYHPTRALWSADKLLLTVPRMSLTLSAKAFCVSAPSVWNSLSYNCWTSQYFQATFKDRTVWHCLLWMWTLCLAPPTRASDSLATYGAI